MEPVINQLSMKRALTFDEFLLQQLQAIYEDSFRVGERTAFDKIVQELCDGRRLLYTTEDAAGALCAFFLLMPLFPDRIYFGEYLAVKKELRNRGLGGKFLQFVLRSLKEVGAFGFIFEVEDPDDDQTTDRDIRRKRIEFYRRNGARIVECASSYVMPNLTGEGVLRMRLMWIPFTEEVGEMSGLRLRSCVTQIYTQAYGREKDDPLLKSALDNLAC